MWNYEKRLQYPVNIKTPNAKIAQFIMSQYGGPDGEIGASMRYLSQRFSMPNRMATAVLNDVATEELAHLEMVSTIVHQLTQDLSMEEIEKSGFGPYYIDHGNGIWPQAAGGIPFNACEFQSKGDPLTDLFEDLAAEQKARATYDNILRVVRDIPEIADPIRFLRAREVVHFQRFGERIQTTWNSTAWRGKGEACARTVLGKSGKPASQKEMQAFRYGELAGVRLNSSNCGGQIQVISRCRRAVRRRTGRVHKAVRIPTCQRGGTRRRSSCGHPG